MISIFAHCGYLSETSRMIEIHRALAAAGIEYDLVPPRLGRERSMQIARSYGQGSARESMLTDAELRAHALAEASYLRELGASAAVTGITISTLLSTRLAGVPPVTEHAGTFVPPVFERGLLPTPSTPMLVKLPRFLGRSGRESIGALAALVHRRAAADGEGTGRGPLFAHFPLPVLQLEQDLYVALVERQGATRLLSRRDAQTPLIAAAARQILSTPSYRRPQELRDLRPAW